MHRRLCIQKDLSELNTWIQVLESINTELDYLSIIEKQLIKIGAITSAIRAFRRKNILVMANLCKYEQELKTEIEYGKIEYDSIRLKSHILKREHYLNLVNEFNGFRNQCYMQLKKFKR
nr:hypothetical protein [uncultured Psychroserpens sp.]